MCCILLKEQHYLILYVDLLENWTQTSFGPIPNLGRWVDLRHYICIFWWYFDLNGSHLSLYSNGLSILFSLQLFMLPTTKIGVLCCFYFVLFDCWVQGLSNSTILDRAGCKKKVVHLHPWPLDVVDRCGCHVNSALWRLLPARKIYMKQREIGVKWSALCCCILAV